MRSLLFPLLPSRLVVLLTLAFVLGLSTVEAITVLFIGGGVTPGSGADGSVMSYLENRYGAGNISYQAATASSAGDEAGFDVVLLSSTVTSGAVRGKFHNSTVPVLNWESVVTDNDAAGEFGVTTRLNEIETDHTIRILAAHPITAGFAVGQLVQFATGSSEVYWSVPPESTEVTHLAEDDDTAANKFLSILEAGQSRMGGGVAPARRVMFGLKDHTFNFLTAAGETLFGQAIDWAAAGAVDPDPPTVVNRAATEVGASVATIGGEITDGGGVNPVVTLFWGDNDGGIDPGGWDQSIDFGPQGGSFSGAVSNLAPSTTYYFRSSARNTGGEDWADSTASFTTLALPGPPVVINLPASGVTYTEADLNGTVLNTGGEAPNVTIYFGPGDGGTVPGDWADSVSLGAQFGVFRNSLFALSQDTTYYFRAFAENTGGQSWALISNSFRTSAFGVPAVSGSPATGLTGTSAMVGGTVDTTGGDAPGVVLYWGESDGGTDPNLWDESVDLGPQSADFSTVLSGLSPLTTYHVRAFAQNAGGSSWAAASESFTTLEFSVFLINEFMAANDGGASSNPNGWWPIANQVPGTNHDWIEILNTSGGSLDLGGWHLTDNADDLTRWTFPPDTILPAGEFLIVYASGNDEADANGNLHTNFALAASGEYVALVRPNGTVASEFGPGGSDYPVQEDDVSYGLHPVSGVPVYFTSPTPGSPNDASGLARVADTKFTPNRGYYQSAFELSITTETPGATIYFTIDGRPPLTAAGSPAPGARVYSRPILVNRTLVVRAAAILPGFAPTNIDTHTYLMLDIDGAAANGLDEAGLNGRFLQQTRPSGWGALSSGDFNMDTAISRSTAVSTGHGGLSVAQALLKGMRDIPTVSIAMDRNDFTGGNGIYSRSESKGFAWERDCSAEFIPAVGDVRSDWGETCGIRVQGGASRNSGSSPKHSLSFRFRAEYGAGKLRQNLFPDGPVDEFNVLVLRAGYNNSWIHRDEGQRGRGSMIRDQWARETMLDMGHPDAGRGFMVHVFVNGLYWGVHNLCERQDAAHYSEYHGGDADLLDARNGAEFIDGSSRAWNTMQTIVSRRNWTQIQQVIDIDTYIDYQIVNRFGSNADLKTNGNWRAAGGGPPLGGQAGPMAPWKLYSWDAERILEGQTATGTPLDPMGIRGTLEGLPEYRIRFADRLQKHFFHGGALTPEACKARWMKFAANLDRAIIAESARWGDHRRSPAYSRNGEWLTEQNRLCNSYFPVRSANVFSRYRGQNFYPSVAAPLFRVNGSPQHGGEIPGGGTLTITGTSGTIYYTLDGSDPRLERGAINPSANSISSGQTVTLPASLLLRARARNGTTWSALEEASFYIEPLATPADLSLAEINYHPAPASAVEKVAAAGVPVPLLLEDPELFEFIEIYNRSVRAVNLDGVSFAAGIEFTFGNTALAAGARAVVVKDPEVFAIRYPGVPIAGTFAGNLDNDGERLALVVNGGDTVHDFTYRDAGQWPSRADGIGSSLEPVEEAGDYTDPLNWRASGEFHGSPGAPGSGPDGRIVINEVLTRTDLPRIDAIELHNTTGGLIDVSGWVLSDSSAHLPSFAIPDTISIAGGGYFLFDEDDFNVPAANAIGEYGRSAAASLTTVTAAGHGLGTGDLITISGYGGLGAYNDTFEVTVVDADSFTIEAAFLDDHGTKGTWTPGRPFALDGARGDELWLLETDGAGRPVKFVDYVNFEAAFEGESLGRWPNGAGSGTLTSMSANTLGIANAGPQVGPVVISEVMYQPAGGGDGLEFVEICNTGAVNEELQHWRLRGGADFEFAGEVSLAPEAVLVIVPFDPVADPAAATSFRTAYRIDSSIPLAGPFTDGPLRDDDGSLRLQRPDQPPAGEPGFHPAVTEDAVTYRNTAPWPAGAAGGGDSLQRSDLGGFGNFAASWNAAGPNPGGVVLDYAAWRDLFFGAGLPAGSGPLEDFNRDAVPNLFAFGVGMNPLVFEAGLMPEVEVDSGNLRLTYSRNLLRPGLTFRVEASDNLVDWYRVEDVVLGTTGYIESLGASLPLGPDSQLFMRLVIEQ